MEHFLSSLRAFCGKSFVVVRKRLEVSWQETKRLYRPPARAEVQIVHFVSREQVTRLFEVFDLAPVLKPERRLSTINGDPSNIEWLIVMWQTSWDNKRLQRVREHFRQRNIDSLP